MKVLQPKRQDNTTIGNVIIKNNIKVVIKRKTKHNNDTIIENVFYKNNSIEVIEIQSKHSKIN